MSSSNTAKYATKGKTKNTDCSIYESHLTGS